jgi:hypothetical protein
MLLAYTRQYTKALFILSQLSPLSNVPAYQICDSPEGYSDRDQIQDPRSHNAFLSTAYYPGLHSNGGLQTCVRLYFVDCQ